MRRQTNYNYVLLAIAILASLSTPAVARPASQLRVTPLRELVGSWLPPPLILIYNNLVSSVLPTSPQSKTPIDQEPVVWRTSYGGSPFANTTYDEQLVLRFYPSNGEEAVHLAHASSSLLLDVWESNKDWVDVRVQVTIVPRLLSILPGSLNVTFQVLLDGPSLLDAVTATYPSTIDMSSDKHYGDEFRPELGDAISANDSVFFSDYRPLTVIVSWMNLMSSMFPDHSEVIEIGKSYEGRGILALRVGFQLKNTEGRRKRRKTIIVSGGMHGREWVGVSTVNYIAYSLITGYGKYLDMTAMVENFDWIFIPTLNPDGYEYTWQTDRLWRKTRQPTPLRLCQGIDLDRAFGFQWTGESVNPCSENYAGQRSFESIEAQALSSWAKNATANNDAKFVGYLDMHSYSQQILYPYSYSCGEQPPTLEDLQELAQGLAKAIRLGGVVYQITSACSGNVLSSSGDVRGSEGTESGGSALDWFYHELGIRYAFQFKLRDNGAYGFLLPKEYIAPTGAEILNAVRHFAYSLEAHDDDNYGEFVIPGLQTPIR